MGPSSLNEYQRSLATIDDLLRDLSDAEFMDALADLTDAEIARTPVGLLDRVVAANAQRARAGASS